MIPSSSFSSSPSFFHHGAVGGLSGVPPASSPLGMVDLSLGGRLGGVNPSSGFVSPTAGDFPSSLLRHDGVVSVPGGAGERT